MIAVLATILSIIFSGALMILLAWHCMGEYRWQFRHNPRLIISLEVFAYVSKAGGLGYFAVVLFIAGALNFLSGSYALLWVLFVEIFLR